MNGIIKTFVTNEIFSCNVYVIKWKKWWIVIDPWFYNTEIQDYLKKIWWVEAILLTHGHWDHIRFVDEIKNDYPNAKIYIHEKDKELLTNINLNCSLLVWRKEIIIKSKVEFFDECNMEIWWYNIRIIHLLALQIKWIKKRHLFINMNRCPIILYNIRYIILINHVRSFNGLSSR